MARGVFLTMLGGFGREEIQLSNENRAPGCLGYIEDYTAKLYGDYFINHELRIPNKQPV